ncbi:hypothetical protein QGN29_12450 [Temperatibacter marinus]|uniref:DUF4345 domain-containing protein n=1 Tax=Temperatibacter marinus TaxID=1456591 RepID=A0AA52HA52_9PROT|nr:hypothetical protein [Temperatibacter marinus]WND02360.1 hypothetical protein QGN29_12450 [Temperatibacter marinus]
MIIIIACGVLMSFFCLAAFLWPQKMVQGILRYSQKSYFQSLEVGTRFLMGAVFVYFSDQTNHPRDFLALGYLIMAVSFALMALGGERHSKFAVWITGLIGPYMRWVGLFFVPTGFLIIYWASGWTLL